MTRLLYIDCVAGVAGDMLLAALLDAGADVDGVRNALRRLELAGLDIEMSSVSRHGIVAQHVVVQASDRREARTWRDVRRIVAAAGLAPRTEALAQRAFALLAEAEGRVHGVPPDAVHFHEVGGDDALADVCGVAAALESLRIDEVVCSPLPVGRGFVDAAHGRLPLPAPATLELLRGAPLHGVETDMELVTPTGAALVVALASGFGTVPALRLEAVGYGAGTRDLEAMPNVVRVLLGVADDAPPRPQVAVIETNLDDLSPELVPDAADQCFAAGALDVWTTPAQMKKGRPGFVLAALARPDRERAVAEAMLRSTSTLGVRVSTCARWELERDVATVVVADGEVRVKLGRLDGELINVAPEHDDCKAIAARTGVAVKDVWGAALVAAQGLVDDER